MTNKKYEQKPRSFQLLRILLLTLIVFCCLFLGHYGINVFYYKKVKTNSGLTYRIIPCKDLAEQSLAKATNDEKVYILYQQEILYKGKIIAHRADFTRRSNRNESVLILPYFMYLDSSSLNCIDGGICELLNLCKSGVALEAQVLAYTVLSRQNIDRYKIHDINSKVMVRIYPIAFCSYDKIEEELTKYSNKMLELQAQQRNSNKEKLKDILKKKYSEGTYKEIENGFVIRTNNIDEQEHISENSIVSFDISLYNITTRELIFTTLLDDAIKDGRDINVQDYRPMTITVTPDMYYYFKILSSGGEYEIYTPLFPQFFGDTQLYLLKIKNLEVKNKGNKPLLKNPEEQRADENIISDNIDNKDDNNDDDEEEEDDNNMKKEGNEEDDNNDDDEEEEDDNNMKKEGKEDEDNDDDDDEKENSGETDDDEEDKTAEENKEEINNDIKNSDGGIESGTNKEQNL